MIELSVIRDLVAIFGVIAGFSYYVLTVRNASKARKVQTLMQVRERALDKEFHIDFMDLLDSEWSDYDDYQNKYGSSVNREFYSKRFGVFEYLEGLGYLLHQDLIDIESIYFLMQVGTELQWQKWRLIIYEERKRMDNPDWWIWFEYLANETTKFRKKRGIDTVTRLPRKQP